MEQSLDMITLKLFFFFFFVCLKLLRQKNPHNLVKKKQTQFFRELGLDLIWWFLI